jgi:hypothetical protein
MTKQEIAAALRESLRRELLEIQRLEQCEHDYDFIAMLRAIIDDLSALEEKSDLLGHRLPYPAAAAGRIVHLPGGS